jgi:hypothetical protein
LLNNSPLPTINQAFNNLVHEETRLKSHCERPESLFLKALFGGSLGCFWEY